jgi:hypothetical protein
MRRTISGWLAMLALSAAGCGDDGGTTDDGGTGDDAADEGLDWTEDRPSDADADADGDGEAEVSPDGEDLPEDAGPEDVRETGPVTAVALPQAVRGAMWANPATYDEVPLHVVVTGTAETVEVTLDDGAPIAATDPEGDDDWVAPLPIAALPDGAVAVEAVASGHGGGPFTASAELLLGREGVQQTVFGVDGSGGTPRIHRDGDGAWITWTDRSTGEAEAWLQAIDGAGRRSGDRIALVGPSTPALYARTAFGASSIGVLYQSLGSPYVTRFKVAGRDGTELLAPIELEPAGWRGAWGGDVTFDGTAYVAVWRVYGPAGETEVRWLRVAEGTWSVTGPVVVAAAGAGTAAEPEGGFDAFTFVDVAAAGERSIVGFVRGRYDGLLELEIPRSQVAAVAADGTVGASEYVDPPTAFLFHRECRVFRAGDGFAAVWSRIDLGDPSSTPPNLFYAATADADGRLDPARGLGTPVFDAVDDRDEPFLLPYRGAAGILAWWDHRAYTLDPSHGRIELYAAATHDDLTAGEPVVFAHARCVAGTTMLWAAPAGTNALLTWVDERHGGGVLDPRPEVYFETAWR